MEADKKLIEADSKISKLQREKRYVEDQLEATKRTCLREHNTYKAESESNFGSDNLL